MRFHLCMRRFAPTLVVLGACNSGVQPTATSTSTPTPAIIAPVAPEPIVKGIPHGGQIIEVAATDDGDAAITFDAMLGVRLWPALDGSRPPIPLTVEAPRHVSLAHDGQELLAVITSDAGSVRVMQVGRDGRVHSNVTLPAQYLQAVALDGSVVVRTADHAIERYAVDGKLLGRVVADPGKQVTTIVTRHGHTIALMADAQLGTSREVRRLVIDDGISWGATLELPQYVQGEQIAISPSGRRIAYGSLQHGLDVWEMEPFKRAIIGSTTSIDEDVKGIGFLDDAHVVVAGAPELKMWTEKTSKEPSPDPWAVARTSDVMAQPREQTFLVDGFAIADGKVLRGFGVALTISTPEKVQYLGYKALPNGLVTPAAEQFAMTLGTSRFVWLDDKLVMHRDADLKDPVTNSWMFAIPLDEHHVVTQTSFEGSYKFAMVDVESKAKVDLGTYREGDRMQYDGASHLLGIKEGRKLHRFAFDAATSTMSALPDLRIKGQPVSFNLFDPAKANGMTAAVVAWDNDNASFETLTIYRETGKPTRIYPFNGTLATATADGTIYFSEPGFMRVYRNGEKKPTTIKLDGSNFSTVSRDGLRIAYTTRDELIVTDAMGMAVWRQPQWGTNQLVFSADGKTLVVHGVGGLAAYDATTGARTARECGWNFGLYDDALDGSAVGAAPMCEDPMLQ